MVEDVKLEFNREGSEVLKWVEGGYNSALIPLSDLDVDRGGIRHRIIEGDNLVGLDYLEKTGETVDVVLIDVPYNNSDIRYSYNDSRGNKGVYSEWLSFLEERIELGYKLLEDGGVMFIHISDKNAPYLTLLCDGLFGDDNRLPTITWKTSGGMNFSHTLKVVTETILVYKKGEIGKFKRIEPLKKKVIKKDKSAFLEDGVLVYRSLEDYRKMEKGEKCPSVIKESSARYTRSRDYILLDPDGNNFYLPGGEDGYNDRMERDEISLVHGRTPFFEFKEETVKDRIIKGEIFWVYDGEEWDLKKRERLGSKNVAHTTLLDSKDITGISSKKGFYDLVDVVHDASFSFPKPEKLEEHLLKLVNKKKMKVLDFFGGSGTTLSSILKMNKEGYEIECILMTSNENNICREVCYERASKVIKGYKKRNGNYVDGVGGSLRYYKSALVESKG